MKKLQEINRLVEEALNELQSADVKIEVRKILASLARKCAEIDREDDLKGALKVCSCGDITTWGYLLYFDETEGLWCVKLMTGTHNFTWWHESEITVMCE